MKPSTTIVLRDKLSKENLIGLNERLSVVAIGHELDVSTNTVYRAFRRYGIEHADHESEFHKPKLAEVLTKETLSSHLHEERLTVAEVAAKYSVSSQTVYRYVRLHQIEKPQRNRRTKKPDAFTADNVRRLYLDEQKSLRQTANEIGVSDKMLRDLMRENAIPSRTYSQHVDSAAVSAAYLDGSTMGELADQHGCSVWKISQCLDKTGTPKRKGLR